jgi:uncharacterized membrane protein YfbV (UPF0208 family)
VITVAVICGLFSVWFHTVLNDDEGIFSPLNRLLRKNGYTEKFMECPWCSGAWFAIIPSLILFHDPLDAAIITAFAAAAIAGLIGMYVQGE